MLKFFTHLLNNKSNFNKNRYYKWNSLSLAFDNINSFKILPSSLLLGINYQKELLLKNTKKFADGFKTNNTLLWGVRGSGKSTLIKSIFNEISISYNSLKLIELNKKNINQILEIYMNLENYSDLRFIIFIDDLSFEKSDSDYKIIKSMLEGGINKQPNNVIIYATSNRRHLMPEDMINNERSSAIHTHENIEEKISLSDRFGVSIGFYNLSQDDYINIIKSYGSFFKININEKEIKKSLQWSILRGNRTGRTAWQFILDLASDNKILIDY